MSTRTRTTGLVVLVALLVGLAAAGGVVTSQTDSQSDTQQTSHLRVVHASADAPAVDVSVDNESVLTDVAFGEASEYLSLEAGTHNVTVTAADDPDDVLYDDEVTLAPRTATTFAAAGETGENASTPFEPLLYDDDALAPGENESAVSVIHLSPDAPAVDVTTENGSVVLAENVSYGNASDYATVPADDRDVTVREATETNDGPVVTTANVSLENGSAYSALAVGSLDSGDVPTDADDEATEDDEPAEADAEDDPAEADDETTGTEESTDEASTETDDAPAEDEVPADTDDAPTESDGEAVEEGAEESGNTSADAAAADSTFDVVVVEDVTWSLHLPSEATAGVNDTATADGENATATEAAAPEE